MIYLRDQLARADFNAAEYYASRDAWVAVVGRTRYILANYQGASVMRQTLELQMLAYERLEMEELARDTERILDLNYPNRS